MSEEEEVVQGTSDTKKPLYDEGTQRLYRKDVSDRPQKRYRRGDSPRRDPPRGYQRNFNVERRVERHHSNAFRYGNERSEWRCLECHEWNFQDELRCVRCGIFPSHTDRRSHIGNDRGRSDTHRHGGDERELELDEFGRIPNTTTKSSRPKVHEWPPCFEDNGSAFVFDSRSGMFYESLSDFFYDPQTKLYYGNKKNAYFSYDKSLKDPFVLVQTTTGQDLQQAKDVVAAPDIKSKKLIAINLKTKSLSKPKAKLDKTKKEEENDASSHLVDKKVATDLQKWAERQEETLKIVRKNPDDIQKTPKGEPICELCRRKFQSIDQLRRHENLSELHKQNLMKAAKRESDVGESQSSLYVDRAEHRRRMYGHDQPDVVQRKAAPDSSSSSNEVVQPAEPALETSVGKQLLHRLGWKEGQSLGNRADQPSETMKRLVNDWDKIESLSADAGKNGSQEQNG